MPTQERYKTMSTTPKPRDLRDIHEIYTAEAEIVSEPRTWTKTHVTVYHNAVDGTKTPLFDYPRNYSFRYEFEPFRQLQGDEWHDYALISTKYTTFQVLDLETLEIVAERATDERGDGFCPREFYVPDLMEVLRPSDFESDRLYLSDVLESRQGLFGFYSGCVWGDDWSDKLRYIDLSKISEGIVTEETRYGYWPLPNNGRLRDHIEYDEEAPLALSLMLPVDVETGEIHWSMQDYLKWAPKPKKDDK